MSSFPHPQYDTHVLRPAYADALEYLFEPMLSAHEAHAIALGEAGIISDSNVVAILGAVATVREEGAEQLGYEPGVEDLFFRVEARIIGEAGESYGGNLQLARSRNDLGQALFRIAFRTQILSVASDLVSLREEILSLALDHLETIMPGYTHTQPAQPVTFAHYLAGVLSFLESDQERMQSAYASVNQSPLGAAAFTGSGFPIDRERVAELLGFDRVIQSTHHSIGAGDHLTDTAFAVQSLAIGLGRMTRDLLFYATRESGALRIGDEFVQISSIMPQKRNPVVLEHLRARLARTLGYAQTVVVCCHNIPYGDTQDIEDEIMPPMMASLSCARDVLQLYRAVFASLEIDRAAMAERAGRSFMTTTELADGLVREAGLPFRTAHGLVARLVRRAAEEGLDSNQLDVGMLQEIAQSELGRPLEFSREQFERSLDPGHFVRTRDGVGGVAPAATGRLLDQLSARIDVDRDRLRGNEVRLESAREQLRDAGRALRTRASSETL